MTSSRTQSGLRIARLLARRYVHLPQAGALPPGAMCGVDGRQVVALGGAAREDDLPPPGADERGDLRGGPVHGCRRLRAVAVLLRGVAERLGEVRQDRLHDRPGSWRCCRGRSVLALAAHTL